MSVPLDLLWAAWPSGVLQHVGLTTRGGWHCAPSGWLAPNERVHQAVAEVMDTGALVTVLRSGALLPNVDPTDVATWAAVKADLAVALSWDPVPINLVFEYETADEDNLSVFDFYGAGRHESFRFADVRAAANDAVGLVLARIAVREEYGR